MTKQFCDHCQRELSPDQVYTYSINRLSPLRGLNGRPKMNWQLELCADCSGHFVQAINVKRDLAVMA